MKAEFANPLYNISPSAQERARLPMDHPDYSPSAACPPKLLFPEAHRKLRKKPSPRTPSPRRRRPRSPSPSPGGKNSDALPKRTAVLRRELVMAMAKDGGKKDSNGKKDSKKLPKTDTKKSVGKSKVDDPVRLAMGPVRR